MIDSCPDGSPLNLLQTPTYMLEHTEGRPRHDVTPPLPGAKIKNPSTDLLSP